MSYSPIPAVAILNLCLCHQTYPCLDQLHRYNVFVVDFLPGRKLDVVRLLRSKLDCSLSKIVTNLSKNPILVATNILQEESIQVEKEFKLNGAKIEINLI